MAQCKCKSVQVAYTKNNLFPVRERWTRVTLATDRFDGPFSDILNRSSIQATAADQEHEFKFRFNSTVEESNANVAFTNAFGKYSLLINDKISLGEVVPDEELNVYYANEAYYASPLTPISLDKKRPAAIIEALTQYENASYIVASPYSNLTPAQILDVEPFAAIEDIHAINDGVELFFWWSHPPRKFELIETGGTKYFSQDVDDITNLQEVTNLIFDEYLQFQHLLASLGATITTSQIPFPISLPEGGYRVEASVTWENAITWMDQEPLLGYNIYVKQDENGEWQRMNEELISITKRSFLVDNVSGFFVTLQRSELFFAVTSIDVHGNESALSPQIAVDKNKALGATNRQISFQGKKLSDKILEDPLTNIRATTRIKVKPLQGLRDVLANEATFFAVDNNFGDIIVNMTSTDICKDSKIRIKALGTI